MRQLVILIIALSMGCSPVAVLGQTKDWDAGAGTNSWHDSDNWDPNGVPTSFNDVTIRASSDSVFVNGNAACNSILLVGDLIIPPSVDLQIAGTSVDYGIEMLRFSLLENEGNIMVGGAQMAGIQIDESDLINKTSGVIEILSSDDDGISIINEGKLINRSDAEIKINSCADEAIYNQDTVVNRGNIRIDGAGGGIENEGQFNNTANGQVLIREVSDGIENYKNIVNRGYIEIRKFVDNGILNDDDDESSFVLFYNSGTILIDSIGDDGIFNRGGMLTIQNSLNMMASNGINSLDSLDNHGSILISNITSNGIFASRDLIYNTGMMRITGAGECGLFNEDQSIFRIEDVAVLTIDNCAVFMKTWIGSLFNCQGELTIDD